MSATRAARPATSDLALIGDFIVERNPSAAIKVELAVRATIELLADFPKLGRPRPELDARSLGVPRYPYTVYYRIEGNEVWVVHIRDDRRKPVEHGKI